MSSLSAINLSTLDFLLSDEGRTAAAALSDADLADGRLPGLLGRLRRRFTPEQAGALVALARLRQAAAVKFPQAHELFFTAEALEQATHAEVAATHADWLDRHAPPGLLLDLGCGIGGDLLALARRRRVVAYEVDPLRARFAAANAAVLGLAERVEVRVGDWVADLEAGRLPPAAGAFADPARRSGERRIFHLDQVVPPISALLALQAAVPALGVKVMPGVADAELPTACGVEFISHAGVCKEAVLWFGPLRRGRKWATLLRRGEAFSYDGDAEGERPPLGTLAAGQVLYEPDCALMRAGCLAGLCRQWQAQLFDPEIAYLVGAPRDDVRPQDTRLAQAFSIDEVHPFALKLLNTRLQALGIAEVELKKRGFPQEPESLRPRLKLARQGRPGVVIFSRRGDEHIMILGQRLRPGPQKP